MTDEMHRHGWTTFEFVPHRASRELWQRFHRYRQERELEHWPGEPLRSDEACEHELIVLHSSDPDHIHRRFLLEANGEIVGQLITRSARPGSPAYDANRHLLWAAGTVLARFRRRGIGTRWLRQTLAVMEDHGATLLSTYIDEDNGHAFVRWFGADEVQTQCENRLDFRQVDWAMIHRWIAEGHARAPGSHLLRYERRLPDELLDEFCARYNALGRTVPVDAADYGEVHITPDIVRTYYRLLDELGGSHHVFIVREPDGTISGITDVVHDPSRPGYVQQLFTGVDPVYRGRGQGKRLKAAMLAFLSERHPETQWVVTGNATSNAAMLGINRALGFREHRAGSVYQLPRDRLLSFLAVR